MGYQPTFKLFHQLFICVKSNRPPLYELRLRATECGYSPGYTKPIIQKTSLKFWNREVIFLRGLYLDYMPRIAIDQEIDDFYPPTLKDEALVQIRSFCNVWVIK